MLIFKTAGLIALLLLLFMVVVGCQSQVELSQLAVIVGLGLDPGPGGGYELTVELAHQQLSNEPGKSQVITVSGQDLDELEAALRNHLDREPNWGNAVSLVIGTGLGTEALDAMLFQMYQDFRFNPGLVLLLAEGRATDALNASFGQGDYVAQSLAEALEREARANGAKALTLTDYLQQRLANAQAQALPLLRLEEGKLVFAGAAPLDAAAAIPALHAYE